MKVVVWVDSVTPVPEATAPVAKIETWVRLGPEIQVLSTAKAGRAANAPEASVSTAAARAIERIFFIGMSWSFVMRNQARTGPLRIERGWLRHNLNHPLGVKNYLTMYFLVTLVAPLVTIVTVKVPAFLKVRVFEVLAQLVGVNTNL